SHDKQCVRRPRDLRPPSAAIDDRPPAVEAWRPMQAIDLADDPRSPVTLDELTAARERLLGIVVETPLLPLRGPWNEAGREIYLKLENLQPINAFKIRGATNAVLSLLPQQRARGVWTISAGNAGQGVAYAARAAGVPCTVVTIDTAPDTKVRRMRDLGATLG